jgi:Flp pilus assembly protein TadB
VRSVNLTRWALILGAIPVLIGLSYLVVQEAVGIQAWIDPAGVVLLVALGLAMGFGMLVILRGARDL